MRDDNDTYSFHIISDFIEIKHSPTLGSLPVPVVCFGINTYGTRWCLRAMWASRKFDIIIIFLPKIVAHEVFPTGWSVDRYDNIVMVFRLWNRIVTRVATRLYRCTPEVLVLRLVLYRCSGTDVGPFPVPSGDAQYHVFISGKSEITWSETIVSEHRTVASGTRLPLVGWICIVLNKKRKTNKSFTHSTDVFTCAFLPFERPRMSSKSKYKKANFVRSSVKHKIAGVF